MKNIKTATMALVFALSLVASAALAETNSGALVNGTATVNAGASITGNANNDSDSDDSVQLNGSARSESEIDSQDDSSSSVNGSSMILLRSDILNNTGSENNSSWNSSTWMNNSSTISSDEGYKAYVSSAMQGDENFSKVDSDDTHVSVSYKEHAKLFGFIPASIRATSTIDSQGNVKVRYPWYRFLMSTNKSEIEAKLNADIKAMGWKDNGSGNASFNAATRAKLVSSMYSAMHRDDASKENQ